MITRIGIIGEPSNLDEGALERGSPVGPEVVGGFAIGTEVDSLIVSRGGGGRGGIGRRGEIGEGSGIGEEKVHAVEGAAGAVGLRPDLAGAVVVVGVGPTVVPLVTLLDPNEGLTAALVMAMAVVEVVDVGGDRGCLCESIMMMMMMERSHLDDLMLLRLPFQDSRH